MATTAGSTLRRMPWMSRGLAMTLVFRAGASTRVVVPLSRVAATTMPATAAPTTAPIRAGTSHASHRPRSRAGTVAAGEGGGGDTGGTSVRVGSSVAPGGAHDHEGPAAA